MNTFNSEPTWVYLQSVTYLPVPGSTCSQSVTYLPVLGADNEITYLPVLGADNEVTYLPVLGCTCSESHTCQYLDVLAVSHLPASTWSRQWAQCVGCRHSSGVSAHSDNAVALTHLHRLVSPPVTVTCRPHTTADKYWWLLGIVLPLTTILTSLVEKGGYRAPREIYF